ncbi:unnamed protein product [Lota lota]
MDRRSSELSSPSPTVLSAVFTASEQSQPLHVLWGESSGGHGKYFNAYTAGTKTHTEPSPSAEAVPATRSLGANTSHTMQGKTPLWGSKDPEDIPTLTSGEEDDGGRFIIELCEPIQVTQLDIANFELFSSTPKDFLVSISNRYPTNKWLKLGTFHGRDERTVQSFPLDEHLYAKYVKVELVSHFGSEHFCPLSLVRVFGTSMVEEYEENTDPHDRTDDQDFDLEYPPGYVAGELKSSKNLIGSAKEVILNMVTDFAVNVLGGGKTQTLTAHRMSVFMATVPFLAFTFLLLLLSF